MPDRDDTHDVLAGLVEQGLVEVLRDGAGENRYRLDARGVASVFDELTRFASSAAELWRQGVAPQCLLPPRIASFLVVFFHDQLIEKFVEDGTIEADDAHA